MHLIFGLLLLLALTASALPLTHRFAGLLPDWTLSRDQVDQLASSTFLTAFVGLLMTVTGVAMVLVTVLPEQPPPW
jgi:hypothetical protein